MKAKKSSSGPISGASSPRVSQLVILLRGSSRDPPNCCATPRKQELCERRCSTKQRGSGFMPYRHLGFMLRHEPQDAFHINTH